MNCTMFNAKHHEQGEQAFLKVYQHTIAGHTDTHYEPNDQQVI